MICFKNRNENHLNVFAEKSIKHFLNDGVLGAGCNALNEIKILALLELAVKSRNQVKK